MSHQRVDRVSLYIDKKLALLSRTHSGHCIFRVHDELRKENEQTYEPTTIAIGPYHHGKKKLEAMEEHKLRYLHQILCLNNESSVDRYVMALRELEERARNCYAESVNLDSDEFVEMMLLDGCFINLFFQKCMFKEIRDIDQNDPIFQYDQTRRSIRRDLILFENQLPFFILDRLFGMTKFLNPKDNMVDIALHCLMVVLPLSPNASDVFLRVSIDHVHHLLGLVHEIWCSSFVRLVVSTRKEERHEKEWEFIKCTSELQEAGVKFKKSRKRSISLLDIKFENGVMEIPCLPIDDDTQRIFRNLIVYEQYSRSTCPKYITDYTRFMGCLINSSKDVEKLCHNGIIINWLGDDEAVSTMFNKLGKNVWISKDFCYSQVFQKVNGHCRQRRNIWLANLRRNYFNNPWSIISFLAAAMLLLLTLLQTIFSFHK